jgi:metal-responsive CopG/Arc/MetJ family transcriptional regulator
MRVHINLEDRLVAQLDRRVGRRKRSAFIAETVRRALDDERRWDDIQSSLGKIADTGHEWDSNASSWVRQQRRTDARRVG